MHALERLRLCCSILLVRDNEHNTHQKHFTSLCPGLRKTIPSQKTLLVLTNRYNSNGCASNQTAQRTTPCHANNELVVHFVTHTPTPTHTTLLVVASKHRSAANPTERWWCMRWNVYASAVRSCSCETTNTTHTKNISIRCALGCGKITPFPKNLPLSYTPEKFKRLRFKSNIATNYTLARKQPAGGAFWDTNTNTNTHYTASSSIQASFGCPANPAPVVHALERLRLCCSILLVRDNEHNTHQKQFTSLCLGLRKRNPFPKNPSRPYKLIKFKRLRFKSNGATNDTLARKQPAGGGAI